MKNYLSELGIVLCKYSVCVVSSHFGKDMRIQLFKQRFLVLQTVKIYYWLYIIELSIYYVSVSVYVLVRCSGTMFLWLPMLYNILIWHNMMHILRTKKTWRIRRNTIVYRMNLNRKRLNFIELTFIYITKTQLNYLI